MNVLSNDKIIETKRMEKKICTLRHLFYLVVVAGMFTLYTGCDLASDSNGGGIPEIEGVRHINPDSAATMQLEQVGPGETFVITGRNLKSVSKVYFNGLEASFNPVLVTNTNMIITVPGDMPFGVLDPESEEMNTIKFESSHGDLVFEFPILPPMPQIQHINKEFAGGGETLTIQGRYLYLVTEVTFPGGLTSNEFEFSDDGSYMTVIVPDGITEEGFVNVTTSSGSTYDSYRNMFNNTTGVFVNFDDKNPFTPWGATPVVTNDIDGIEPLDGNYLHWHLTDIPAGLWWSQELATPMEAETDWPDIDPNTDLSDLVLRFEMNIPDGLNSGWIKFNFNWAYEYDWNPFVTNDDERITIQTDGWETFTIPLEVLYDLGATYYSDIATHLHLFYVNPDTGVPVDELSVAYDNFRIVQIQ